MTRTSEEHGSALVVAIGALLVMSLLAAAALKAATTASGTSNADARNQQALQAAESALQTAAYRLNMLQPAATSCIGTVVETATSGTCSATAPEALGNGATFSYRTTPALSTSDPCAGLPVKAQVALQQRCITATGTVDGVSRRLQARVAAYASTPLFPVAGIIGLTSVGLTGNIQIPESTVGTNGLLSATGNVRTGGTILGSSGVVPAPDPSATGNVTITPITRRTAAEGPIVLAPVTPGNSAAVNDNARIANGLRSPRVAPYDAVSGTGLSYDPATRALRATGNATLTLGGGVYNFCSVRISGNFTLLVAAGAKVSFYVDSPDNPNSGCPSGTGDLAVTGNFDSGSSGSDPTALQLYLYGTNDLKSSLSITGNGVLRAAVYAPKTTVSITGNAKIIGGVAANKVTLTGNGFQWDGRVGALQAGSTGLYYRTAWRECPTRTGASATGC